MVPDQVACNVADKGRVVVIVAVAAGRRTDQLLGEIVVIQRIQGIALVVVFIIVAGRRSGHYDEDIKERWKERAQEGRRRRRSVWND